MYTDLVFVILDEPARRALEAEMNLGSNAYPSGLAQHFRAEGRPESLLDVLEARGFSVDGALRTKIKACHDAQQLRTWLARALTASELAAVFA